MDKYRRRMKPLLGTYVEIGADLPAGDRALESAFKAIEQVQRLLSRQDAHSELSKLNTSAGQEIVLHPVSAQVLRLARALYAQTGGLFDGGVRGLCLRGRKALLRSATPVTLDGIAKGYAVDRAVRELRRHGAVVGWVNAGGDMRVFGDLALPVHRRESGGFKLIGHLRGAAVATSRVSDDDDPDFPGNIVSSYGGRKPEPGVWTVLAKKAWLADALTKVASLADPFEREALVRRLGGSLVSAGEV